MSLAQFFGCWFASSLLFLAVWHLLMRRQHASPEREQFRGFDRPEPDARADAWQDHQPAPEAVIDLRTGEPHTYIS